MGAFYSTCVGSRNPFGRANRLFFEPDLIALNPLRHPVLVNEIHAAVVLERDDEPLRLARNLLLQRGFAVVASEVRTLAEGCRVAANEINALASSSVTTVEHAGTMLKKERLVVMPDQLELAYRDLAFKSDLGMLVFTVSVKGTIFSVNKGTLGSRVSVAEGEVQVSHGGRTESLKPGQQTRTSEVLEAARHVETTWRTTPEL